MERRKFIQLSAVAGSSFVGLGAAPFGGAINRLSMSGEELGMLKEYERQFAEAPFAKELSLSQTSRETQPRRILKSKADAFSYKNANGSTVTLRRVKDRVIVRIG